VGGLSSLTSLPPCPMHALFCHVVHATPLIGCLKVSRALYFRILTDVEHFSLGPTFELVHLKLPPTPPSTRATLLLALGP